MPVYIVGFDARNSSSADDYAGLQNAVAKLERHRLMPWLYLVSVPFTAGALKEYLLNHMCDEDRLWISKVSARATFEFAYQTTGGTSSWLKKHSRIELPAYAAGTGFEWPIADGPRAKIQQRSNVTERPSTGISYAAR